MRSRDVLTVLWGEEPARVPKGFRDAVRWSAGSLTPEQLSEIRAWPLTLELEIAGPGRVLFCHATPRDDNEIFTRLTPEDRLRPLFTEAGADVVVCGHTHMPFERTVGDVRVVNAGSVGMPFGEPGACWALLGPGVELRRTEYDLGAAAERIRATDYPRADEFDVTRPPSEAEMLEVFEAAALRP